MCMYVLFSTELILAALTHLTTLVLTVLAHLTEVVLTALNITSSSLVVNVYFFYQPAR